MQGQREVRYGMDDDGSVSDYPTNLIIKLDLFGWTQVAIGLFCVFTQSAGIFYDAHLSYLGTGIWTGILIISSMVICIVSAVVTSLIIGSAVFGLHFDTFASYYFRYNKEIEGKVAVNVALICVAVLEASISIWSSALCCRAACCQCIKSQKKTQ